MRASGPKTESPCQASALAGPSGMRPRVGLSPNNPQNAAGIRIEPAPSLPCATPHRPAATAAPDPPLEPPGVRSRAHGLRVAPKVSVSVNGHCMSSGTFVRPTTIAPAARSRATTWLSCRAGGPWAAVPQVVTSPATSASSLIATGTPSSGASPPSPADRRASARPAWVSALSA